MRTPTGTGLSSISTLDDASQKDPWEALASEVREAKDPWDTRAIGALYALALAQGIRTLRSLRGLDDALRADLALGTFLDKLPEIVHARRPRAFFCAVVWRDALSWLRSPRSKLVERSECVEYDCGPMEDEETRALYWIDGREALDAMPARDRAVLVADAQGHARDDIARAHGTSRANIDQIVSRARRGVRS